jgi:hypothetical protein
VEKKQAIYIFIFIRVNIVLILIFLISINGPKRLLEIMKHRNKKTAPNFSVAGSPFLMMWHIYPLFPHSKIGRSTQNERIRLISTQKIEGVMLLTSRFSPWISGPLALEKVSTCGLAALEVFASKIRVVLQS